MGGQDILGGDYPRVREAVADWLRLLKLGIYASDYPRPGLSMCLGAVSY
jgi:hypothetical protein